MAKLMVTLNGVIQGHYFVDKDTFTIGRNADNDIALDDPCISKLHAVIVTLGNDQVMEDVGSANGVLINGKKTAKRILQNNDMIGMGAFELKYMNQRVSSNMDFEKTQMLVPALWPNSALKEHTKPVAQPQLDTAISSIRSVKESFPLGGVQGISGELTGQEIVISRPLKTFGRPAESVVMIARRPCGYYVTHVVGKKTTKLNGKRIGDKTHLLYDDDVLQIADHSLRFFLTK